MTCKACPFSMSEEAEQGFNYGCLPSIGEVMQTGRLWGCHEETGRVCVGHVQFMAENGKDYRSLKLLDYETWYYKLPSEW